MKKTIIGAEAVVQIDEQLVTKTRVHKGYRNSFIDKNIIRRRTRSEIKILTKLKHLDGIPKIISHTDNSIVLEKINGVTLSELNHANSKQISHKIALILKNIHDLNIVHGDVTPKNIMISSTNKVWIIDFGLSQVTTRIEDKANDLWMTKETFIEFDSMSEFIIESYLKLLNSDTRALFQDKLDSMAKRGRHRSRE